MQRYVINNDDEMQLNDPTLTPVTSVDIINSGNILALGDTISIDTVGKGTVTIQVSGTWAVTTGGLYVEITLNGIDWILLSNPYSLLKSSNMDFDGYISSGTQDVWQLEVTGYSKCRVRAIGTGWSGTANIFINASSNVRTYLANTAGVPYTKFLTIDGTGTGGNDFIGDYSTTIGTIFYQPPSANKYYINSVLVQISDTSAFNQQDYAAGTALTNGVTFWIEENGTQTQILSGTTFKTNLDWYSLTPHITLTSFSGTNQTLVIDFTVNDDFGLPLCLNGNTNMKFIVKLHDNFTGLVSQKFSLHGRLV